MMRNRSLISKFRPVKKLFTFGNSDAIMTLEKKNIELFKKNPINRSPIINQLLQHTVS